MGAVAWGALLSAIALATLAVGLERWRRSLPVTPEATPVDLARTDLSVGALPLLDLAAIERAERAEALAFDRIVGHLLLSDPMFADSADRLARQDEPGPAA